MALAELFPPVAAPTKNCQAEGRDLTVVLEDFDRSSIAGSLPELFSRKTSHLSPIHDRHGCA